MDRIITAFNNSLDGLLKVYEQEKSFREDVIIFFLFFPLALFSHVTPIEKAFLIATLFFILVAELFNTAIEVLVDRISQETHPLSKFAKDIGSAIVMLSFVGALVAWMIIFFV